MTSLCRVLEQMDNEDTLLEYATSESNSKAIGVIRSGMNLSPNFWADFLRLCNQPHLSELLGVRKEIVARWPSIIRECLDTVRRLDSEEATGKKANLITTGYK
jgi:hypothetical protein